MTNTTSSLIEQWRSKLKETPPENLAALLEWHWARHYEADDIIRRHEAAANSAVVQTSSTTTHTLNQWGCKCGQGSICSVCAEQRVPSEVPPGTLLRLIEDSISEAGNAACSIQGEEHTLALAVMKAIEPYISRCEITVDDKRIRGKLRAEIAAAIYGEFKNDSTSFVVDTIDRVMTVVLPYLKREIFLVQEEVDKCKP